MKIQVDYDLIEGNESDRNVEILIRSILGDSPSEISRKFSISRERVGQLLQRMTGSRNPGLILQDLDIDWKGLNRVRKELDISFWDISLSSHYQPSTARRVFGNDKRYTKTRAAVYILSALLQIIEKRLRSAETLHTYIKEKGA